MPSKANLAAVEALKLKLKDNSSLIVVDYRGINAESIKAFRKELNKAGADIHVVKNTLFKIALKESKYPALDHALTETSAVVYSKDDISLSAKSVKDAEKKYAGKITIKGGLMNGAALDAKAVERLADLPSREVLLSQLVGAVQGPITGLVFSLKGIINNVVYTLNAIKDKKSA